MSIQVTLVLDSGAFLTNEATTGFTYSEVGYFIPHLNVYGDGDLIESVSGYCLGTGCRKLNVRHLDPNGTEISKGIRITDSLNKNLLKMHKLHGRIVHADREKFDCCFHFNSGIFRCSHVMSRIFKEVHGVSHEPTGQVKTISSVAHDVVIEYELKEQESFQILAPGNGKVDTIWSSLNHSSVSRRFDLEIIAENATSDFYFREMLKLGRQNYWLPNQGQPPPQWNHDGGLGG
ncbi:MAG: hypothetical protein DMF61_01535 [Blastocatellia bacterium AA13]|nr:MAG: hypothetical protein DMF61_01535 [Blastocatellia bacterium AA13]